VQAEKDSINRGLIFISLVINPLANNIRPLGEKECHFFFKNTGQTILQNAQKSH